MKSRFFMFLPVMASVGLFTTGCMVPKSEYDSLRELYLANQEANVQLETRNDNLKEEIAANEMRLARVKSELAGNNQLSEARIAELNGMVRGLQADRERLEAEYNSLSSSNKSLAERNQSLQAENEILARGPVAIDDPVLHEALRQYAATNPNIVEYDAAQGMVKLKSDLTFALGSADLTANAKKAINDLAKILNSSAARKFEVRIVGHTDNTPVVKPETKKKFGNNWMLSAFRANSVREELRKDGVSSNRMMIAGYGPYRPVAAATKSGRALNRRVEIFLVPMSPSKYKIIDRAPASTSTAKVNKDSVINDGITKDGPADLPDATTTEDMTQYK